MSLPIERINEIAEKHWFPVKIESDKERFTNFFNEFGIKSTPLTPEDVFLEMEEDVEWHSALSVGQAWFLFDKDDQYVGLLNDETLTLETRQKHIVIVCTGNLVTSKKDSNCRSVEPEPTL